MAVFRLGLARRINPSRMQRLNAGTVWPATRGPGSAPEARALSARGTGGNGDGKRMQQAAGRPRIGTAAFFRFGGYRREVQEETR